MLSRGCVLAKSLQKQVDIILSEDDLVFNLLKDRGLRTGLLDGRATGRFEDFASRRPPYNAPGLGAGLTAPHGPSGSDFLQAYLTHDLKFRTPEAYFGPECGCGGCLGGRRRARSSRIGGGVRWRHLPQY